MTAPFATYRLQFRSGMDFRRAARLIPYLKALGVSHLYASPIFQATPESTHGYDVTDYRALDDTLGGTEGFADLATTMRQHGIKLILDIVPNHMGASPGNEWWRDVLEWGRSSAYADHFDIDWSARKLLVPALASSYGQALNAGAFSLAFEAETGSCAFKYGGLLLPLAPPSYAHIIGRLDPSTFGALARRFAVATQEDSTQLKSDLAALAEEAAVRSAIIEATEAIAEDREAIHQLHEHQVWRLVHWRAAREQLTYRRFFEIADLVGVRVESQRVFDDVHGLALSLVASGDVHGLRIDHVDGLADPRRYLDQLQAATGLDDGLYVVIEKILGRDETLRAEWPVAGTTGYEFIAALAGLFTDARGLADLNEHWEQFAGPADFAAEITRAKREMMWRNLAGELGILKDMVLALTDRDPMTRDFGADTMRRALVEFAAALPLYRTYVDVDGAAPEDEAVIAAAVVAAKASREIDDEETIDFVGRLMRLDFTSPEDQAAAHLFVTRFQQTTGAVMAKAVEDTVFYRLNRLIALNEVGGDPDPKDLGLEPFHAAMALRRQNQPYGLSTTSTHDTKRGEDARARLYALSEMATEWGEAVMRWHGLLAPAIVELAEGLAPEPNIEWLFYQAAAGAWPFDLDRTDTAGLAVFRKRLGDFMEKAVREAKLRTTWIAPHQAYEQAVRNFVELALDPARSGEFLGDFTGVIKPLMVAGALTSLTQTLVKLAAPGIPDIYQGSEGFDLSFVDPDNRRPIDFESRAAMVESIGITELGAMTEGWKSGAMKLHLLRCGLALRQRAPALMAEGEYLPLPVEGPEQESVVAFARRSGEDWTIAVAPCRTLRLTAGNDRPEIPGHRWHDTAIVLPTLAGASFVNELTGEVLGPGGRIPLADLLDKFPVALVSTVTP
jgi:(1->4)-alpha-D-glucan 1-alpha-D-glucosylmutase